MAVSERPPSGPDLVYLLGTALAYLEPVAEERCPCGVPAAGGCVMNAGVLHGHGRPGLLRKRVLPPADPIATIAPEPFPNGR